MFKLSPQKKPKFRVFGLPQIPTENLVLWLDASKGIVLDTSGTTTVAQWQDQSGNGNHAAQGAKADQPVFLATGINGLPGLEFNGGTRALVGALAHTQSSAVMFMVAQPKSTQDYAYSGYFSGFTPGNSDWNNTASACFLKYDSTVVIEGYRAGAKSSLPIPAANAPFFAASRWDGINHVLQINDSVGSSVSSSEGFNFSLYSLGARYANFTGTPAPGGGVNAVISEVMFYNSSLNNTDYNQVVNYLKQKYSI